MCEYLKIQTKDYIAEFENYISKSLKKTVQDAIEAYFRDHDAEHIKELLGDGFEDDDAEDLFESLLKDDNFFKTVENKFNIITTKNSEYDTLLKLQQKALDDYLAMNDHLTKAAIKHFSDVTDKLVYLYKTEGNKMYWHLLHYPQLRKFLKHYYDILPQTAFGYSRSRLYYYPSR